MEDADAAPILRSQVRTRALDLLGREHGSGGEWKPDGEGSGPDRLPNTTEPPKTTEPISYLDEEELLVRARQKIVAGENDDAIDLLERLDDVTRTAGRLDRLIRVLLVKALARKIQGDVDGARTAVAEALNLGERAGYFRVFLDEEDWLDDLLRLLPRSQYRDHVLANMDGRTRPICHRDRRARPVWRWYPTIKAMTAMIVELLEHPELGLMNYEYRFSFRRQFLLMYWRSFEHMHDWATSKDNTHADGWRMLNKLMKKHPDLLGFWHESFVVTQYESFYRNVPEVGLGKAGTLVPVKGGMTSSAARLRAARADATPSGN